MKKLTILFALLTLSVGLWAETVSYLDPVYNNPTDVTKGIKEWKNATADATPITSSSFTWGAAGITTWLVVDNGVTLSQRVTCNGDVRLILANNVTLRATKGITVSGQGNSLTIYAQSTDAQMGKLAAGGAGGAAGIGGDDGRSGSNITINGGNIVPTGGDQAAGIGGGYKGSGSNITINGGTITAVGGSGAAGIGGGMEGSSSNIFVTTSLQVKADDNYPPTTVIENNGNDLADKLAGKKCVTIKDPLPDAKTAAIEAVNAEIAETDNDNVKAIATDATTAINDATSVAEVNALKNLAIANIASAKAAYTAGDAAGYARGLEEGKAAGLAEAAAALPTDPEGTTGHTVTITKGDKTLRLINPDSVEYDEQD